MVIKLIILFFLSCIATLYKVLVHCYLILHNTASACVSSNKRRNGRIETRSSCFWTSSSTADSESKKAPGEDVKTSFYNVKSVIINLIIVQVRHVRQLVDRLTSTYGLVLVVVPRV